MISTSPQSNHEATASRRNREALASNRKPKAPISRRKPLNSQDAQRWARIGVLAALAVLIGWIETFIPLPLPIAGVKLGLANIVVLVALQLMDARAAALVALIKVLATGILFGNPLMMLFSASGTLLAFVAMLTLVRVPGLHLAVVSVAAAMAHNVGQLLVAQMVLGTPLVWYSAPFMLLAACATGTLCGLAASWTLDALQPESLVKARAKATAAQAWQPMHEQGVAGRRSAQAQPSRTERTTQALPARTQLPPLPVTPRRVGGFALPAVDTRVKLAILLVFFVFAFHASDPFALAVVALIALVLAAMSQIRVRSVLRVLLPLTFVIALTVVMQLAYHQNGGIVLQVGPLAITDQGLWQSLRMIVIQASVVLASVAFMQSANATQLVRAFAWFVRPLERVGLNVEGIVLSLGVAMAFIPVLVREFFMLRAAHTARGVDFEGTLRQRLAAYARLFAPLVRGSFHHADSLAESMLARAL